MCEAAYSDWTVTIRLSYRPSKQRELDLAHRVITPRHFQNFIKQMRNTGHKIRYLAVGEYGELRGRAHFHVILFGKGPKPRTFAQRCEDGFRIHNQVLPDGNELGPIWPHNHDFHMPQWEHGHVYADWQFDEKAARYCVWYLFKTEYGESWFSVSKKPALGAEFFKAKAERDAALDVIPWSFTYIPPGVADSGFAYCLTGASRRDYLLHLSKCLGKMPLDLMPRANEWLARSLEKLDLWTRVKAESDEWKALRGSPEKRAIKVDEFLAVMGAEMHQTVRLDEAERLLKRLSEMESFVLTDEERAKAAWARAWVRKATLDLERSKSLDSTQEGVSDGSS